MFYVTHTPFWLRAMFPSGVTWFGPESPRNQVYLTFDDGPTPGVTQFVLDQLQQADFSGTFFLIGENVQRHPEIVDAIREAGHDIGNHTMTHPNGWKTSTDEYMEEIAATQHLLGAPYFRPPYGRITTRQRKQLRQEYPSVEVIMWSVIAGDFDTSIDGNKCFYNVKRHTRPGSIIVFHDSEKAYPRLREALPKTIHWLQEQGWKSAALSQRPQLVP